MNEKDKIDQKLDQDAIEVYGRGEKIAIRKIKNKKQRENLKALESKYKKAALDLKDAELLNEYDAGSIELENPLEKTYKIRQDEIFNQTSIETIKKGFELKLDNLGPYQHHYTRNGKYLLLASRKGHVSSINWRDGKLNCELQLKETIRDVTWLNNENHFAIAQKKYVFIYDHDGIEIHRLSKHIEVLKMEFLPFHFLLSTIGISGHLKYTDTSTGQMVSEISTKLGTPTAFRQNPYNAILHVGHQNGQVTLWSPNSGKSLVKLQAHHGPLKSLAIDRQGKYMVTTSMDSKMSVWDIRNFKCLNTYYTIQPGVSLDISDQNLTAIGLNSKVEIWRDLFTKSSQDQTLDQMKIQSPYMNWESQGKKIECIRWCPFEDVLGVSHDLGYNSLIIPGSGESNFDSLELNPFETKRQKQELEVKQLLNKLQPGMISLNPHFIGNLDTISHKERLIEKDFDQKPVDKIENIKNRGRGRNSTLRRLQRKKALKNIVDESSVKIKEIRDKQLLKNQKTLKEKQEKYGPSLRRFIIKQ